VKRPVAVVTGASSGIGAATVSHLRAAGFEVVGGARRLDLLRSVTDPVGATAHALDVTDPASGEAVCAAADRCGRLVDKAGGAVGGGSVEAAADEPRQRK
jgi:NADP-dependent 3-hydroxy acid dehydrogenase YdfG